MTDLPRPGFRPAASPVNTVAVQTRFTEGPRPVAPVKPLAPIEPTLPNTRPTAPTPPTFLTPPTPPPRGPNGLQQLGEALSALNPKITGAMDRYFKGRNEEEGLEAELHAMRNSASSWADAVAADPSLADRSPFFRQVYEGRMARTRVQRRGGELFTEYLSDPIAGSDDPTAIDGWLSERMASTIDEVTSPAARATAIEELRQLSDKFISTHRENAKRNLLNRNRESMSGAIQSAIDNTAAQGPAVPYQTDDPVSSDLKPHERAFLNGIAGGESAGKYNVRYTPAGGALFDLNGTHPRLYEPGPEGPSSAAGRYQFVASTWDQLMGKDTPFTPENQDRAALALGRQDYKVRTGRDLDADLQAEGFSPRIQKALAPTWRALQNNHGRHLATYNHTLQRSGQKPTGIGADNAHIPALVEDIQSLEREARKQGMSPAETNKLVVEAITNAAVQHRDVSFLDVATAARPDGTPGPGMTVEGREKIENARRQIGSLRVQEQDMRWKHQEREREVIRRNLTQTAMASFLAQMDRKEPPRVSNELLALANQKDPALAKDLMDVQKRLDDHNKTEDPVQVAAFATRVYSGEVGFDGIMHALKNGDIKDYGTVRQLLEEARRTNDKSTASNPTFRAAQDEIRQIVGAEVVPGLPKRPVPASHAMAEFRKSMLDFAAANPGTTEADTAAYAEKEKARVINRYAPEAGYGDGKVDPTKPVKGQSAVTAPTTPTEPRKVEWRKVPVYQDTKTLDAEFARFKAGDVKDNAFVAWMQTNGLKDINSIGEFYVTQKRLIEARSKR